MPKPYIAVTMGDPAGISYEIVWKAANSPAVKKVCNPILFGDKEVIKKYCRGKMLFKFIESSNTGHPLKTGVPSKKAGRIALAAIEEAVNYCMEGKANALVTAPVSKESFKLAGVKYPGHTELLAALTKSRNVAMLMACGDIHGVMVTRHIPISEIHKMLKSKNIIDTIKLSIDFIGRKNIRTALCALNPHAGDNSILGCEEQKIIMPAYKTLFKQGINISKPLPADSVWMRAKNGDFDLVCTMYHDQLMIPLKCINAKKIVNVTAGLPFIRTSPGHGTAFDIAGKNKADITPMIESILYAVNHIKTRN
ncbi:MAG: 4-hydroxythreonine-4-phosphate dehydrogenase PdxA [Endomicrobium sp.]|jgi:4-hydroxythreonine-4-phosphate dehydrogenase|nr:4-hydroxythreonine-4-phosphate dehydrogenase PdxA [Endomicrobium sp.]